MLSAIFCQGLRRGGSWFSSTNSLQCAVRGAHSPFSEHSYIGFRPVRNEYFFTFFSFPNYLNSIQAGKESHLNTGSPVYLRALMYVVNLPVNFFLQPLFVGIVYDLYCVDHNTFAKPIKLIPYHSVPTALMSKRTGGKEKEDTPFVVSRNEEIVRSQR